MSRVLLEVESLSTHFMTRNGVLKAVNDVSFTLHEGEIIGLVGESGSGKSVTGFSILGLVDPPGKIMAGSVRLQGRELVGMRETELRHVRGREISMVFQDPSTTLNPVLSIGAQMRLALSAHEAISRQAADARCIDVLNKVGIPDAARRLSYFPHQFSGGMRQRVAIAIALLNHPKLIICDEPTTALDVSIQAQILMQMKTLARDFGTAMIWISHDLSTVSSVASQLLVMYAGRIIESGPARDLLRRPHHPYTQGLLNSLPEHAQPGQSLEQIPGQMPSLINLGLECAFLSRCTRSDHACQSSPALRTNGFRGVRCHHPVAGDWH
jgi:peptide/nickel transport system ATP-binding protein